VVQTRGALVTRDLDLLRQVKAVRVNVSIPTDSEEIRKAFEPKASRLEDRWAAVAAIQAAGVPVGICVTPTLPVADPAGFADRLAAAAPALLVVQDFHDAGGKFGADTGDRALQLAQDYRWEAAAYRRFVEIIRDRRPVFEGEAGFFPPSGSSP
jgi:DNA repair photolyase